MAQDLSLRKMGDNVLRMDILPIVIFGAFSALGLAMLVFGGPMARGFAALADIIFKYPTTKWPAVKPIIQFVFRNPASNWIMRALGFVIALSCGLMLLVILLLRP